MSKILLLISILIIGIIALPRAWSLFAGQHDWYDTTKDENQIPCLKCHADIEEEISQPGTVNLIHKIMNCDQCHITAAPNSEGLRQGPGGQFHAAATASCIDCHNKTLLYGTFDHARIIGIPGVGCLTCHRRPIQGPDSFSAVEIFTGSEEVHKDFANAAKNFSLLKDRNEACISCHTHVRANISWARASIMSFNASIDNGTWSLNNFTATGENITHTSG